MLNSILSVSGTQLNLMLNRDNNMKYLTHFGGYYIINEYSLC